ncbi:unnamed protein product [Symbiodinium natans]|uniref:CCHC-type domain-containing protein n=1 Tax=Symbiodinium natans TaxID=878477 RepID=A0A812IJK9_9DINO|nr:unnamed protein product [Symbiodinium natans]
MAELEGELAGKLRLPLPSVFNGNPESWEEWEWNFTVYVALFDADVSQLLERSAASDVEIEDAHIAQFGHPRAQQLHTFSRKLHVVLANLTSGAAKLLVRQNIGGNGFETWRRLKQKFSMPDVQREHSLLAQVLDWRFNTATFEQDFNAWETVKIRYETLTGTLLPDGVLIATLLNKISGPLQQHLRLNSTSLRTFAQMREIIVSHFRSRLMLQGTATSQNQGPAPMDVGAVGKGYFGKGKGKKGKGGKGGFGHWNFMKGKGKGKSFGKGPNFGSGKKGSKGNFSKGNGKGTGGFAKGTSNKGNSSSSSITCWTCGKPGHTSKECFQANRVASVDDTSALAEWQDDGWYFEDWNDFGWDPYDFSVGAVDDFGYPWYEGDDEPFGWPIGLLSVRLTSQQITNFIDGNHFRVWNRRYIDYFINVTSGDFENRKHFRDGQHIVDPQASWHLAGDFWISRALAVQSLRARY